VKKLIVAAMLVSFVRVQAPVAASAESVFDPGKASRLSLTMRVDDSRAFGAADNAALGGAGLGAAPAPLPSPRRAAASSLLLPGLGQQKLGHPLSSKIYFGLEGIAWLAVGSYLWVGHSRADSYRAYAVAFAGVVGTDHPDDYYGKLAEYVSSDGPDGYNESVRREARELYYPDVAAMDAYYEAHMVSGDDAWRWRSDGAYDRFQTLRDGSRLAYRIALYTVIGAAALRLVSAADAVRLARTASPAKEGGKVSLGFEAGPQGPSLYVQKAF
jgi:hypothetical protein